jgi:pSer/pThr/pTyr-binding forkhead associated (FHA) protein
LWGGAIASRQKGRKTSNSRGDQDMSKQLYLEILLPSDASGEETSRSFHVDHFPSVIGRAQECDFQITNPLVSRRHCCFFERDNEMWVCDLKSHNGTYVNGERVSGEVVVHDRDTLDIGPVPYRIRVSEPSRIGRFLHEMIGGQ